MRPRSSDRVAVAVKSAVAVPVTVGDGEWVGVLVGVSLGSPTSVGVDSVGSVGSPVGVAVKRMGVGTLEGRVGKGRVGGSVG
jgi:hypothetical protein